MEEVIIENKKEKYSKANELSDYLYDALIYVEEINGAMNFVSKKLQDVEMEGYNKGYVAGMERAFSIMEGTLKNINLEQD
jgi:hypothetical protein